MDFTGKVAIVTGGASGMGAASARQLSTLGASVLIADQNEALAHQVVADIKRGSVILGDVSQSDFCQQVVASALEQFGRLDILVNAAGIILRSDARQTNDADWQRVLDVNVNGVFYMSRAAIDPMLQQRSGAIINFGSIWGSAGATNVVAYCASKGAVHQITRAMALDHAEDGIRINAVCPGEVDTPMLRSGRTRPPTEADLANLATTVPMLRLAAPEEIAQMVCFLASDKASYITGALMTVDGGYSAR